MLYTTQMKKILTEIEKKHDSFNNSFEILSMPAALVNLSLQIASLISSLVK